jgi:hypothetical protein
MFGLLIVFVLLGIGFAAGYATRGVISRKRRAQYLAYEPYLAPPHRPPLQSANLERAVNRSSEQVSTHKTARGNLRVVSDSDARPAAEPPTVHSLEELIRLLGQKK